MSVLASIDPMLAGGCLAASFLGTLAFRRVLLRAAMFDLPNERSSHSTPIARGGGVVFVLVSSVAFAVLVATGALALPLLAALGGLLAVAAVGFLDDRRPVGAAPRLAVHMSGAAAAVFAATEGAASVLPPEFAEHPALPVAGILLLALASAWMVNLVNFIDGIDGLASLGGASILAAAALLPALAPTDAPLRDDAHALRSLALAIAAAVAGFGLVNISRWRIFMGDAGSGALGLAIAFVLIALAAGRGLAPLSAIALPAIFVTDATVTLTVRMLRREHPARAHRTHAYQRLLRRGFPHLAVTAIYLATFALAVLPVALYAQSGGKHALLAVLGLYATLAVLTLWLGAGREPTSAGTAAATAAAHAGDHAPG